MWKEDTRARFPWTSHGTRERLSPKLLGLNPLFLFLLVCPFCDSMLLVEMTLDECCWTMRHNALLTIYPPSLYDLSISVIYLLLIYNCFMTT